MAIKASGPLSLSDLVAEFGGTAPHSLSEYYRGGGLVPNGPAANANVAASGAINLGGFYGAVKLFVFSPTISGYITNYNIRSAAIAAGWDQSTPLQATITNNGVIGSNSTGAWALVTDGSYPAGSSITIINNNYITGRGGDGGNCGPQNGGAGGPAFLAQCPCTVYNNGVIQGGGGGGGAGQSPWGGGGGGSGYPGGNGGIGGGYDDGMGSNGRVGTLTAGGIGGFYYGAPGGGPGSAGAQTPTQYVGYGGAGGQAVGGNGYISWGATGTRYGAIG